MAASSPLTVLVPARSGPISDDDAAALARAYALLRSIAAREERTEALCDLAVERQVQTKSGAEVHPLSAAVATPN
jgi:hypothetical protein